MKEKISFKSLPAFVILGIIIGLIIGTFKKLIALFSVFMKSFLDSGTGKDKLIFMVLILLIGLVTYFILKTDENTKGSGIPVMVGMMDGTIDVKSEKTIVTKFIASILTIGSGLTVGREGPSVHLGGLAGDIASKFFPQTDRSLFIGSAASSGFAVAFNSPVAALIFNVEEIFRNHNFNTFLTSAVTIISATISSGLIFGDYPSLGEIPRLTNISQESLWIILILGLLTGLSGVLFNTVVIRSKDIYKKIRLPEFVKYIIPFVLTGLILLIDQRLFASGEELIFLPTMGNEGLFSLIYIYLAKILLLSFAFGAGLSGGSLVPLLSIGAILGNIYATILAELGIIPIDMIYAISLITMAGHFSAIVRTPLTAIILVLEITGGAFTNILALALVSLMAYLVAEMCKSKPFYEDLYDRLLITEKSS
ncbi:chloride channel protein [uncultured Anaerococcus sp.]|uniref:chloride channel protein n=1 Tax=uncultured Anaerococcus sp. TaxID=293428 RepID=UPI0025E10622|nr:chloride channel protein [uncultured Anaerococcus sp.]